MQIVETGSISHAARSLGVAKSTISERLAQLEHLVGEPLISRSTRQLSVNEAGRRVYADFLGPTAHLRSLDSALQLQDGAGDSLRIASTTDIGAVEIAAVLAEYCDRHPQLGMSLSVSNELVDPLKRGFDLALHFRRIRHAKLRVESIVHVPCGLYASPHYLKRSGVPTRPEELRAHACLGYMYQPSVHDWIPNRWDFEADDGTLQTVEVELKARFNSGIAMRQFALAGQGLAILPKVRVAEYIARGELTAVLCEHTVPSLELFAVYPRAYISSARLQDLLRFLREALSTI